MIQSSKKGGKRTLALHWQILMGIGFGAIAGLLLTRLTPFETWSPYISWAGDIFLRALRMIVIPLVFTSIAIGVAGMSDSKSLGRVAGKTFGFYALTTAIAATVGLILVNLIKPGKGLAMAVDPSAAAEFTTAQVPLAERLVSIVPSNIFESLAEGNLLPIIFFAVIFGFFMGKVETKHTETLRNILSAIYEVTMKITFFVIRLAPFGVFAIVAGVVGRQAGDPEALMNLAGGLGTFVLVIWAGLLFHGGCVLPALVRLMGRQNPWKHISKMSSTLLTAFSTSSSGAALPINIRDTQEKCGVSPRIAGFVLPLGCTINMNGTALYECVTALFIAQAYGIDLSLAQQILLVLTALVVAVGTAGIPMAGLVMLTIVLTAVGLPLEGIGLILAVEYLCDMPRSVINVYGDSCAAIVVASSEGEKLTIDD